MSARLALALAASAILSACSGEPSQRADDVLDVAVRDLPPSQGNPFTANGPPSNYVWSAIFDGLTRQDAQGRLVPALATRWRSDGAREWIVDLRRDVRFHNGERFDSEAVVAAFDWLKGPEGARTVIGNELRIVEEVRALGTHSVRFVTAQPDAILPNRLASVMIPAPGAWRELGPEGFSRRPVGTGPFAIREWDESSGAIALERFAASWRPASVGAIRFVELTDASVVAQALISGEVDIGGIGVESIGFLRSRQIAIHATPSAQVMSIAFVVEGRDGSPLADERVRRALNYAVDRETLASELLGGLGRPAGQPATPQTPGHIEELGAFPHDPQEARRLLAAAGYPEGFDLALRVVAGNLPGDSLIYQATERYLDAVGVRTTIQTQPFPNWLQDYLSGNWGADGFGLSWNAMPYNDIQRPLEIFSCQKRNPFFCDAQADAIVAELAKAMDPAARARLLREAGLLYRQKAPAIFLVEQIDLFGSNCLVGNLAVTSRSPDYSSITLDPSNCEADTP